MWQTTPFGLQPSIFAKLSMAAGLQKMRHTMKTITPQEFESLLLLAAAWAAEQEERILQSGVPLNDSQLADAQKLGLAQPGRVRLLRVAKIPLPNHPVLVAAASETNLISPNTAGLTVRYGIFVRDDCWLNRLLIAHELVHTMQYERFGDFTAFLRPYLTECLNHPGYPYGHLEVEADVISKKLCDNRVL